MHLLEPVMLMKVHEQGTQIKVETVNVFQEFKNEDALDVMDRALKWYIATQRKPNPVNEDGSFDLIPKGKPIQEAYVTMLGERGVHNQMGIARSTISNLRRLIREQQSFPSDATMRDHLTKAGWTCMQQELWARMKVV